MLNKTTNLLFSIYRSPLELPDLSKMATFSVWDYIILVVMLMISASIGLYYRFTGGKQKTTKVFIYILSISLVTQFIDRFDLQEYFLADSGVSVYPVAFSLMASFMSAITLVNIFKSINYPFSFQSDLMLLFSTDSLVCRPKFTHLAFFLL